jgi:hypothetical protein
MAETVRRTLVRRAFFRLSLVVLALLVPLVVLAVCDRVEARRLRAAVAEIQGKGEPVTLAELRARPATADGLKTERYFRAAAVLASDPRESGLFDRVRDAERTGEWPAGLVEEMRAYLGDHEDALRLLDRAALLPFEGFSPETADAFAGLLPLARLAALRTWSLSLDRDGNRATDSLYAELRLRPAIEWAWLVAIEPIDEMDRVGRVLSAVHPTSSKLSRIEPVLADLDRDDGLKRWFLRRRAALIESPLGPGHGAWAATETGFRQPGFFERMRRPWMDREITRQVEMLSRVISALDEPWPERGAAIESVGDQDFSRSNVAMSHQILDDLALVRSARVAVAIERYRREHAEAMPARLDDLVPAYIHALPVDPYSGQPLLLRHEARSYAVYSLGPNRRDDGGDFTLLRFVQGVREPRDVGTRIQYR